MRGIVDMDQIARNVCSILLLCGVLHAARAHAQQTTLAGRVVRSGTNVGIPGAEVILTPRNARVLTDAAGEFRFDAVPAGYVMVHVRRIGFAPESLGVNMPMAAAIDIELREAAQKLDTVSVSVREEPIAAGKLAGFYERKQAGFGKFVEAKEIENMLTRRLGDIIVARMPGTRTVRGVKGGMAAYIATTRMAPEAITSAMKGAMRPPPCYPDVYVDGTTVYSSGSERNHPPGTPIDVVLFDVNSIDPAHVAAMEFYAGAAQMPAQYNRTGSACGALLIWTK